MALSDDQFSFGGVTLGAGTAYRVRSVHGLRGNGDVASNDTPLLTADGSFSGYDTTTGRTIEMTVTISAASGSAYETALAALEAAMASLLSTTSSFHYKMENKAEQKIEARPRKCDAIIVPSYSHHWTDGVGLVWFCPSPAWVAA